MKWVIGLRGRGSQLTPPPAPVKGTRASHFRPGRQSKWLIECRDAPAGVGEPISRSHVLRPNLSEYLLDQTYTEYARPRAVKGGPAKRQILPDRVCDRMDALILV